MNVDDPSQELVSVVRSLREEVAHLAQRIAALEAAAGPARAEEVAARSNGAATPVAADQPAEPEPAPQPEELSEELVLVISAAIAAYLGKKPYIRQIRLVTSPTWSHQGRVSIQASHALGRSGAAL